MSKIDALLLRRWRQRPRHCPVRGARGQPALLETLEPRLLLSGVEFPANAGVINVTLAPYYAIPNDGLDDTAAIQQALTDNYGGNRIIYLPDGVYNISNTLQWGTNQKRNILQGQSRDGTIIRLYDACAGFTDTLTPKAMVWTGAAPAQRFRNSIRDITFDVGSNNPGAIGLQYIANNQGSMRNVKVISQDRQGKYGIDMNYTNEHGPCLVRDVEVVGFDYGIRTNWDTASVTWENITLSNQNIYGWWNRANMMFVRNLNSTNAVTVIYNEKDSAAHFVLYNGNFTGLSGAETKPAILNEKGLYVWNLTTSGYQRAITHSDKSRGNEPGVYGPYVYQFASHESFKTLFPTPEQTLQLQVNETPAVPWGDIATDWISPLAYGGLPNDGLDDTAAIQAAIDSGKKTVYLPNGTWNISGTLYLRGAVERFIGCEANLTGTATIQLAAGTAPVVIMERIDMIYSGIAWQHASSRTWVISSVTGGTGYTNTGTGDLYLDDVCGGTFVFTDQNVWARQLNQETDTQATPDPNDAKVTNDGGTVWILGIKTEKAGTIIRTVNGGQTEVIGGFVLANGNAKTEPAFINIDSAVSLQGVTQRTFSSVLYNDWVRETRGEQTQTMTWTTYGNGKVYVGYVSAPTVPAEVVKDTEDGTGITIVGAWTTSTSTINAIHGANFIHDGNTGKGTKSVTFTPTIPTAGLWEVFLKWPRIASASASTPVDIQHVGGTTTVYVNQTQSGSWGVSLGTYEFAAGTGGYVKIRNDGTTGYVIADAVQLIYRGSLNQPPVANNDSYGVDEDTTLNVAAPGVLGNDSDPEQQPLTAVKISDPSHGSLTLNSDGSFTYDPTPGWYGIDSFTYQAYDGQAYSNTATVTITVNQVVQDPLATEGFESGDWSGGTGWLGPWSYSGDAAIVTGQAHSGTYSLRLRKNNGITTRAMDMTGATGARLQLWWKANSFESGEYAHVEVYDGTWHEVLRVNDGQADNQYHFADIDLSSYNMISDFQIRISSHMSATNDYFYVDDIQMGVIGGGESARMGGSGLQTVRAISVAEPPLIAGGTTVEPAIAPAPVTTPAPQAMENASPKAQGLSVAQDKIQAKSQRKAQARLQRQLRKLMKSIAPDPQSGILSLVSLL